MKLKNKKKQSADKSTIIIKVLPAFKPGPLFEYFVKGSTLPSLKHRHRFFFKITTFLSLPSRNNSNKNFTLSRDLIDYMVLR